MDGDESADGGDYRQENSSGFGDLNMNKGERSVFGEDAPVEMRKLGAILIGNNLLGIVDMIKKDQLSLVFDNISGEDGGPVALVIDEDGGRKVATVVAAIDKELLDSPEASREISLLFGSVAHRLTDWRARGFTLARLQNSREVEEFIRRKYLEDQ